MSQGQAARRAGAVESPACIARLLSEARSPSSRIALSTVDHPDSPWRRTDAGQRLWTNDGDRGTRGRATTESASLECRDSERRARARLRPVATGRISDSRRGNSAWSCHRRRGRLPQHRRAPESSPPARDRARFGSTMHGRPLRARPMTCVRSSTALLGSDNSLKRPTRGRSLRHVRTTIDCGDVTGVGTPRGD